MGGIMDHSSSFMDPVTMSSAEAEYNEGCTAFMAASHLPMLLAELEGTEEEEMEPMAKFYDSKRTKAIGENYNDTKHTCHIKRQYHYVIECIASKCDRLYVTCNSHTLTETIFKLRDF
jgi:hypothetical protein